MFSGSVSRARRLAFVLACLPITLPLPGHAQNQPELPRVLVDTTYSPPTRGKVIAVKAGGDLQAALDAARPGDVIELQAGGTFTGNFILPRKPGTGWIHIRSSAHARLPRPGTRVSPAHARLMARIDSPNRAPAIRTAAAAHHYRVVGIEVSARGETKSTGPYSDNNVVYLESEGGQTSPDQVPTDIIFDRCYVHGTATGSVRRGIALNGARMAVVDSYLSDFHEVGADSQAISSWNGPGPFKIVNNYLEGAGENLMFGGADPSIPDLVPSDIEIRGNHLFKPLSWKIGHPTYAGTPWSVKNIFELKSARRVLVEGNLLEHNWQHDQNGFAILFTVRNQDGGAPWSAVEDVTFRKNVLRHSGGGFNILAADNNFPSRQTRRILIQDNLLDDISSVNWGGTGRLFQFLSLDARDTGIVALTVEHNTGFSNAWTAYTGDKLIAVHRTFTFRNNMVATTTHGFAGGTKSWPAPSTPVTGDGSQTLNTFYLAPVFAGNVLTGSSPANYSGYPGNFFPETDADVGFVDLSRGNYRLGPATPYKNAATDGTDPGAAIDALEAATAGAVSGDWAPGSTPAGDGDAATSKLLKGLVADGQPGLAVLVRRNGRTVVERAYGVRDLRTRKPIDARTRFRLASVTKQMTAAAIMLLVRDGRLRYEDTLTRALPGFPAYGSGVTIRHLLTHTSGLPDYEQLMESAQKEKARIWTPERQIRDGEVLALLEKETHGLFAPGTSWAYSNSGYVLLGLVAARAADKPFGDVLRERIFAPLGMTRTLAYEKGKNEVPDRAYGHTKEPPGFRETDQSSTSATLGDGGVYSCLEDLAKWDESLRTNTLLSQAETTAALTPVRLADGSEPRWPQGQPGGDNLSPGRPVAYGFGWFLDPWQGRKRAWHHGETMGFRSIVERFPADGVTIVVLANRGDLDLESLALEIAAAELGRR